MVALDPQHRREQGLRQYAETHPHAGCERLAVCAGVNDPVRRAPVGQRGGCRRGSEPQFAVGGVLHQVNRMTRRALVAAQQLQCALLHLAAGRATGRVLVIRNEVQHFHAFQVAGAPERLENLLEMPKVDAVAVHPHAPPVDAPALHDAEVNEISRILHQHNVARVAKRLGGHVQELLRAVGDDRAPGLVARRLATGVAVELPDAPGRQFAQRVIARSRAVLECRLAKRSVAEQLVEQASASGHRQRRVVGKPGRERDQLGPLELEAHQPRDRRLLRAPPHHRECAWFGIVAGHPTGKGCQRPAYCQAISPATIVMALRPLSVQP